MTYCVVGGAPFVLKSAIIWSSVGCGRALPVCANSHPPRRRPPKKTATNAKLKGPPSTGALECTPHNCLSKSSRSRRFIRSSTTSCALLRPVLSIAPMRAFISPMSFNVLTTEQTRNGNVAFPFSSLTSIHEFAISKASLKGRFYSRSRSWRGPEQLSYSA
jgi:hypothetical protein